MHYMQVGQMWSRRRNATRSVGTGLKCYFILLFLKLAGVSGGDLCAKKRMSLAVSLSAPPLYLSLIHI